MQPSTPIESSGLSQTFAFFGLACHWPGRPFPSACLSVAFTAFQLPAMRSVGLWLLRFSPSICPDNRSYMTSGQNTLVALLARPRGVLERSFIRPITAARALLKRLSSSPLLFLYLSPHIPPFPAKSPPIFSMHDPSSAVLANTIPSSALIQACFSTCSIAKLQHCKPRAGPPSDALWIIGISELQRLYHAPSEGGISFEFLRPLISPFDWASASIGVLAACSSDASQDFPGSMSLPEPITHPLSPRPCSSGASRAFGPPPLLRLDFRTGLRSQGNRPPSGLL